MTVTTVTAPANPQPGTPPKAVPARPMINSDFDTFLKMLTTQLQNQDPMDPIDNSEYAVQLATFSGVEQQVRTNDLLQGLGGQLGVMGMSELAGWVGKQARADMPVWFEGNPVTVSAKPDSLADRAELVVTDATGSIVARDAVATGTTAFNWAGTSPDGAPLPEGRYSLALESYAANARIATAPVESYARIVEARGGSGTTTLLFPGGIEVAAGKVTALRAN